MSKGFRKLVSCVGFTALLIPVGLFLIVLITGFVFEIGYFKVSFLFTLLLLISVLIHFFDCLNSTLLGTFNIRNKRHTYYLAVHLAVILIGQSSYYLFDYKQFDSEIWKQPSEHSKARFKMLDDLQDNYLISGMSQKEVKKILGQPDWPSGKDELTYNYSGFLNPDVISISFEDDKLVSFKTHQM